MREARKSHNISSTTVRRQEKSEWELRRSRSDHDFYCLTYAVLIAARRDTLIGKHPMRRFHNWMQIQRANSHPPSRCQYSLTFRYLRRTIPFPGFRGFHFSGEKEAALALPQLLPGVCLMIGNGISRSWHKVTSISGIRLDIQAIKCKPQPQIHLDGIGVLKSRSAET